MTLKNLAKQGWLVKHKTSRQEIQDLFIVVERDLHDCKTAGLSADWRLNIAYNAAIQAAKAALAVSGFRPSRDSQHFRTIQSLKYTIGASDADIACLNKFRKKRNISDYEKSGLVSDNEAEEMYHFAVDLNNKTRKWIGVNYPQYLEGKF